MRDLVLNADAQDVPSIFGVGMERADELVPAFQEMIKSAKKEAERNGVPFSTKDITLLIQKLDLKDDAEMAYFLWIAGSYCWKFVRKCEKDVKKAKKALAKITGKGRGGFRYPAQGSNGSGIGAFEMLAAILSRSARKGNQEGPFSQDDELQEGKAGRGRDEEELSVAESLAAEEEVAGI